MPTLEDETDLVTDKEPLSRWARDYDPHLPTGPRSNAFTVEGEIQMWGDAASGVNSSTQKRKKFLAKWVVLSLFFLPVLAVGVGIVIGEIAG